MTRVVCDASIIVDAFTREIDDPEFERASALVGLIFSRKITAYVPEFFPLECANALVKYQRRNPALNKQREAIHSMSIVDSLPIEVITMPLTTSRVGSWAFAMNCGAYDAVYIELARMLDASVATTDRGMKSACKSFKVPVWAPPPK